MLFVLCFVLGTLGALSQWDEGDDGFWEDYDNAIPLDEYVGYPDDPNDGNEDDDADNDDDWADDAWEDDDPWEDILDGSWDDHDYDNGDDGGGSSGGSTGGGNSGNGSTEDGGSSGGNQPLSDEAVQFIENNFPDQLYIPAILLPEIPVAIVLNVATIAPMEFIITGKVTPAELAAAVAAYNAANPSATVQTSTVASENLAKYEDNAPLGDGVRSFNLWLQGHIIDNIDFGDEDLSGVEVVNFEDCASEDIEDLCNCTTAIQCGDCVGMTCGENETLDEVKCECVPSNCEYRIGYLHENAFVNKTATIGENTVSATDNFRNENGAIIEDTNCETGKIEADSKVTVTGPKEERDYIKTDGTTARSNYYPIMYLDCPKGNRPGNPDYDSDKPCSDCFKGNPIPGNMKVARQKYSGIGGGLYGNSYRKKWKKGADGKYIKDSNGVRMMFPKWHRGLDIETELGDPIYAMFDGTATKDGSNNEDAGYFVRIKSQINGKEVETLYFHMADSSRITGKVKAGDIIGYQGDSGNLKAAIKSGSAVSHVHIKVKENGSTVNPEDYIKGEINKTTGDITSDCN